jgi:hypothetical protein
MMRPARVSASVVAFMVLAGCGATTSTGPTGTQDSIRVLSASVVPGVPYTTTPLTVGELSKDAAIPGLPSMLTTWGFVQGEQRTFQGESRHLTYVVSRALAFAGAGGAAAFVSFVHANATAYFGIGGVQPLVAQGRPGWQFTPAACSCHMASPVVIGVVSHQSGVAWLEINGPDATPALLMSLLDPSNSTGPTS